MKMITRTIIILLVSLTGLVSCIEDGFSTSPSDQPEFSVDTLKLGSLLSAEPSVTKRFTVHNRHNKSLMISDIRISGADAGCFRMNVDGFSGETFSGIEIRSQDSIFVFVEATLPETTGKGAGYEAAIDFTTNGVTASIPVTAQSINVVRLRGEIIEGERTLSAELPYQIYDSLVVAEGATLRIAPGAELLFHDKAMLRVRGTVLSEGSAEAPVYLKGDRTGNVVTDISFEIMSRQWEGVYIAPTSTGNRLSHTHIINTSRGVVAEGNPETDYSTVPQLTIYNSRIHNSGDLVLETYHSSVKATGSEFSDAASGIVYLQGGTHRFDQCTFANNYLFAAIGGPAVQFAHLSGDPDKGADDGSGLPYLQASITNSIIYGIGGDVSHGDLTGTGVTLRRTLLKSEGKDDDNFIECLWDSDPLFSAVREEYILTYYLREESPAIGAADASLSEADAATDMNGTARGATPNLGAYAGVYTEEE